MDEMNKQRSEMKVLTSFAISVILPVYNCDPFISQCLDSLASQSFNDFEIIVIDDGSTDRSFEIALQHTKHDSRISVYQQHHSFAGAARNLGISKAKGDYLLFLDGDDFFDPMLLEKAYRRITETDADICCFRALSLNNETGAISKLPHTCRTELCPTSGTFNRHTSARYLYCFTTPAPWTKLFKRSFIEENDLRFQETRSANDFCFVHTALSVAERITVLDDYLVTYRQHNKTSLQATQGKDPFSFFQALAALQGELRSRGLYGELRHTFENTALDFCMYNLRTLRYNKDAQSQVFNFLRDSGFATLGLLDKSQDYFYIYPASRYSDYLLVLNGDFNQYRKATALPKSKKTLKDKLRSIVPLRASVYEKSRKHLEKEIADLKEQNKDLSDKLAQCIALLQNMDQ